MVGADCFIERTRIASEGVYAMLGKAMIIFATAAALTAGLTADAANLFWPTTYNPSGR